MLATLVRQVVFRSCPGEGQIALRVILLPRYTYMLYCGSVEGGGALWFLLRGARVFGVCHLALLVLKGKSTAVIQD